MKKVCFFIAHMDSPGGTERVTSMIANQLIKEKYQVTILSLSEGNNPFFELDSDIQLHSLYDKKVSMKKNFIGCCLKIRKLLQEKKIDTLIVVDSILCVFTIPALYGLEVKHICWEQFNFNVDLGIFFRRLGRKWAARYCNYIVTQTKRDKVLWTNGLKNINAQIVPISNPTPYENVNHSPSLEYKIILAMGRLTYQKGFDLLIAAWAEVCKVNNDWMLRIVGSGEDEQKLKEQAKILKISDRIDFVPVTKNIEKYYKSSSFYCLSSRFEGFGMVILEAQSHGIPVISFNCDAGPSDIILNKKTGYLVPELEIHTLFETLLLSIKMNSDNYMLMSEEAKQNSKKFNIETLVLKWKKVL